MRITSLIVELEEREKTHLTTLHGELPGMRYGDIIFQPMSLDAARELMVMAALLYDEVGRFVAQLPPDEEEEGLPT